MPNRNVLIILLLIIAALGLIAANHNASSNRSGTEDEAPAATDTATETPTLPVENDTTADSQASGTVRSSVTLHYADSGFSADTATVPVGTRLTFVNDASRPVQVASDPHPIHTDNTELNVGTIEPGSSGSNTLTKRGTWGVHDHLRPTERMTITVE